MCEPTLMLGMSLAMSAGQAVLGFQAANSQYKSQMDAYRQNAENSALAAADNYSALNIRAQQEGQAHSQAALQSEIEKSQAVASAEVAAAAGGVSGLSVDAVVRDIYAQAGRNETAADTNLRMSRDYLGAELKSTQRNAQNQINSMTLPEKPSAFPFLLQGFASGLNAYSGYYDRKN